MMQCTKVLLENGADPNTQTADGTSVLSVAIFDGDVEVMLRVLCCRCGLRVGGQYRVCLACRARN